MIKKKKQIISFILLIITLTSSFMPILQTTSIATTYTINYYGAVTYGLSKVGKFYVNGKPAFCMDHKKTTPPSGTVVEESDYHDDNILKCLYYGWNGAEQYPFVSEAQGIVYTTLALDHFKNGNTNNTAKVFIDYVNSKPVPSITLDITNKNLTAYLDGNMQRTQSTSVTGSSNYYMTIPLQDGVNLVNETRGTTESGNVNVYGGDTFYLRAPLTVNGNWTSSNITNRKYNYQPLIYKTSSVSHQDLASGYKVIEEPSDTINISVNWLSTGSLKIHKKDDATGGTIANTKFELRNLNNEVITTTTTNSSGYAEISNIVAGNYKLVEVSANSLYISNNVPQEIFISAGETKLIDITNEHKKGSLVIVKVDSRDNKTPIKGVTFEIWNDELNQKVATQTTGEDGRISVDNLRTGSYTVKEIATNDVYKLDTTGKKVEIKYNETSILTVPNEIKQAYISILKVDSEFKNIKIKDTRFEIRDEENKLIQTLITDENGYAKSKALDIDKKYTLKEVESNEKYLLNEKAVDITFTPEEADKTITYTFENEHKKGDLKIYKIDKDNHRISLGNVQFDLYSNEFKKVIGTYTTNVDGEIYIKNLRIGEYRLIERNTGKWYNLADDRTIEIKWNTTEENTIENELKKGQVRVIKVDLDNNAVKLQGVVFEVLDENDKVLDEIITDEKGEAITRRYAVRDFSKLKIREKSTLEAYALSDEVKTIELKENQIVNVKFENELKKAQIRVIKVDLDDNEVKLEGVKFDIKDENGKIVDQIITDPNGEAVTKRLPIYKHEYTAIETQTRKEYKLTTETKTVTLKQDEIKDLIFQNEKRKGQIRVIKTDSENNKYLLKGVTFDVINNKGKVVDTITTDSNGEAVTKRIPLGKYWLKEIKSDDMHLVNEELVNVEVKTDKITTVEIENERIKGQIRIIKTSEDDNFINKEKAGTPISNVKFEIYDSNRNKVDEIITEKDGTAITKMLDKGHYYILEVESGEWYLLNTKEFEVDIEYHKQIVDVKITNESEKPDIEIEKTGIIQTTANQEIKYDFKFKNTGNVPLSNFTWIDELPTDYVRITKLITGTYNQDLNYNIYYKTNLNDYKLLAENLNTKTNHYIDFANLDIADNEYVTNFKIDFGTVDVDFTSEVNPYIFVKTLDTVKNEDVFTNTTRIEGNNKGYLVWDEDEHTTKVYEKEIILKKLPRTGF